MCLLLPPVTKLLKEALNLNKTELNVLWLLWNLKSFDYKGLVNQRTNPGEEILFLDRDNIDKGISVKELQEILNLTQAAVQLALKSLHDRGYVRRKKVIREYRYAPEPKAFNEFKAQLERYKEGFNDLIDPFVKATSSEKALKHVIGSVQNEWSVQGWQELAGLSNFLIRKDNAPGKITSRELDLIKNDVSGSSLTSGVTQSYAHDTLVIKTDRSYTSPFHFQSNAFPGLWSIQNNKNGNKKRKPVDLIGFVTG